MSRRDDIQKLLINYNRRLQALQERQALYGLDTPVGILTEIEEIEGQIEALQAELAALGAEDDAPALPTVTAPGAVGDARAKNRPAWLVWAGVGLLVLAIAIGLLVFWAGSRGNAPENAGTEPGAGAPATVAAAGQSENQAATPPGTAAGPALTVQELEARLGEANIVWSTGTEEDIARVRGYVTGPDSAYYLLGVNSLELVEAQRFKQPEYLDMIDKWYTARVGEENYLAAQGQLHQEELKAAIVQAHNEYYDDAATAFEQLVEP